MAATALLFIARALVSGGVLGRYPSDGTRLHYFVREYLLRALSEHRLPLWNPYTQFGAPFLANIQWGVFYPVNVLFMAVSTDLAYNLFIALHLALAGAFIYLLARDWGLGTGPALITGFAFMFSGRLISWAWGGGLNHLSTTAWLPLIALLFSRATAEVGRKSMLWSAACGTALAVQILSGHPQYTLFTSIVLLFIALWRPVDGPGSEYRVRPFVIWAAVLLVAAGLGAVQLGVTYEATALSTRSFAWKVVSTPAGIEGSYNPLRLLSWVVPDLFGNTVSLRPASTDWLSLALKEPHSDEFRGYIGVLPFVLALMTLPSWRESRKVSMLWALAAAGFVLALGRFTPLYGLVYALVPPFRAFRIPARLMNVVVFALSLLAGIGAQQALTSEGRVRTWGRTLAIVGVLGAIGVLAGLTLRGPIVGFGERLAAPLFASRPAGVSLGAAARDGLISRAFGLSLRSALISTGWILAASAILGLAGRRRASTVVTTAMIAVTVADLGLQAAMYTASEPVTNFDTRNGRLLETLRRASDAPREYTLEGTGPAARPDPIRPSDNVFMHERLWTAGGYDSFELESYRTTRDLLDDDLQHGSAFLASVYGLRYIVSEQRLAAPSLRPAGTIEGAEVYENAAALPRFYVAGHARSVSSDDVVTALLRSHALLAGEEVLVESRDRSDSGVPGVAGTASLVSMAPEHVEVRIHADRDGMFVANETFYPGWTAHVDGVSSPMFRANGHMRAIPVGKGDHTVTMRFSPEPLRTGAWISASVAAALALAVGLLLVGVRAA